MSDAVSVSFRVGGDDVQAYMNRLQQRSIDLSRSFLRNASEQSDVARDQLRSYQEQLAVLERQLNTENQLSRTTAEIRRNSRREALREDIRNQYSTLDSDLQAGRITRRQHRLQVSSLDAREQSGESEIEEQYRQELENAREQHRDNVLLLRTMRDNVDTIRSTSQQELVQMRRGDEALVDAVQNDDDPTALLANRLASQQHIEEQAREGGGDDKKDKKEGTFGAVLKALAFEKVGGMMASIPSAKSELDYVKPFLSTMGLITGGAIGWGIDKLTGAQFLGSGLGQSNLAGVAAQFGEKVGEFFGSAYERTYKSRDELTSVNYQLQALIGKDIGVERFGPGGLGGRGLAEVSVDLKDYAITFKEAAEMQYKIAVAQGSGKNLLGGVENMAALQRGLSVNQDTFLSLTELLRSSREQDRDIMKIVGGIASAGKNNVFAQDRTFLNEFIQKNFIGLQKTLLNTQNVVASGTTFDILRKFDSIGGPFAARDGRSQGLINTIQGSLANPGSDNLKALSFIALRRQNPNMGLAQLMEERQKGLASPAYLKAMMETIDQIGGDKSMKIMNIAGMFGLEGNIGAARLLYENRNKISGKMSMRELIGAGEYSEASLRASGKSLTSGYAVSSAEIENAFIESATEGIKTAAVKMGELFGDMAKQVKQYMDEKVNNVLKPGGSFTSYGNSTYAPQSVAPAYGNNTYNYKGKAVAPRGGGGSW